ncbi:transketolase [Candidatus Gottesmanbacteria bacterium RIFCSPHIGHO2_01_FULL_47_48]|uniref:Transketolase n=1 Tax=Candidatus Gottesmanbacteria bacterium RIFCSPHIGHO2_01_FULL_47_48 TaxID=1798381 RepID=A0A1F6A1C6_9BACT|nr:MAG: transketolase [Candidatus Gottesmanbacteria bacterium RIFCSPHIGHO2_01_FULL_47_48]
MLDGKIVFPSSEMKGCRDGFGEALVELGAENPEVVALCADLTESTRVEKFARAYSERFVEVGVAEQNMMGVAAGLALSGKIPFIASYATFSPGRNFDQLRVSVCYSNTNVKVIGAHAGISVGADGATHQALEDLAMTRVLPNLVVISPADYEETKKAVKAAAAWQGPVYIRFGREKTPAFTTAETPFEIGKAQVLREGADVTIFGTGPLLYKCLQVAEEMSNEQSSMGNQSLMRNNGMSDISCEVVNVSTLKPLDVAAVMLSARRTGAVVTVEEHQVTGGLFGAIAECLGQNFPTPIEAVGMPNQFGESGKPEELLEKYGMGTGAIKEAVRKVLSRKRKVNEN